jgi:hypothetical protein
VDDDSSASTEDDEEAGIVACPAFVHCSCREDHLPVTTSLEPVAEFLGMDSVPGSARLTRVPEDTVETTRWDDCCQPIDELCRSLSSNI